MHCYFMYPKKEKYSKHKFSDYYSNRQLTIPKIFFFIAIFFYSEDKDLQEIMSFNKAIFRAIYISLEFNVELSSTLSLTSYAM